MAILTGLFRITRQAELRHLPGGEAVANLSLAYNYGLKKDERGFLPSAFVEAGLWGKRAESLHEYLEKGKQVFAVLEDVHMEFFNKADGTPGVKLAARVQNIEFVSDRRDDRDTQQAPAARPQQSAAPARTARPAAAAAADDFDDTDIPF